MASHSDPTPIVQCPLCGREQRRRGTHLGTAITCAGCGEEFFAAPAEEAPTARPKLPPDAKQCTQCGETFPIETARCRYCGGKLAPIALGSRQAAPDGRPAAAPARSVEPAPPRPGPAGSRGIEPELAAEEEDNPDVSELQKAILAADRRLAAEQAAGPSPRKKLATPPARRPANTPARDEPSAESRRLIVLTLIIALLLAAIAGVIIHFASRSSGLSPAVPAKATTRSPLGSTHRGGSPAGERPGRAP